MRCYISQLNNQCQIVYVDPKQTGQVVLDKVLESLHIVEVDYFGLQYKGAKGEDLWLNLRNRLADQEIQCSHGVYHLSLRVKFFVQPHQIQQETTRELFYAQIKDVLRRGQISLMEPYCDEAKVVRIVAAIAQADNENGTLYLSSYPEIIRKYCPGVEAKASLVDSVYSEHLKLVNVPRASARNFVLKEVSSVPGYGVEEHKTVNVHGADISFRVGPEGIALHDCKGNTDRIIPYTQISLATHNEKLVHIILLDDAGEPRNEECFKLVSRKAAVALYRCITEMHSFYRCDTVCSNVHSQYSRDFKGTFVSIFNENSDFGKRYIFDIQRTCREAYDLARRKLYTQSSSPMGSPVHYWPQSHASLGNDENGNFEKKDNETCELTLEERNTILQKEVKRLRQRLESLEESLLCCICMYSRVCMVLSPCGHMVCDTCSERIENCPQCRAVIEDLKKVYHTFGLESSSQTNKEEQIV
ncbi:hypothetical protein BsWGS_15607 [Bradybaena similaris]